MANPLIAGNWKMHGTAASAAQLANELAEQWTDKNAAQMIVFPPAVHIAALAPALASSSIAVGAQNLSQHDKGAFTGEISAAMLSDLGCQYVLVGHSERRTVFGDGVIAYEPVWAIGTGETASPQQAQQVHQAIRAQLGEAGVNTSLLYGGSVNGDNARQLFAQPDIDGGLVGGASLEADSFLNIAQQLIEQQ